MVTENACLSPLTADEEVCFASLGELGADLAARRFSAAELTSLFLQRIERLNPVLNAYVTVLADRAMEAAIASDRRRSRGEERGPFDGIPVSVKDVEPMKGVRFTSGLLPLKDNIGTTDALHTRRLRAAGAVILGKTNTPEMGHKGTTDNLLLGPTRNPFRLQANAGGSSGGAAVSVAAGMAVVAQGSDGGGSVRIPAAMTGLVAIKTSAFALPDVIRPDGFAAIGPFTHVGPLGRSVSDVEAFTRLLTVPHSRDPLSAPLPEHPRHPSRATKILFDPHLGDFPVDREVAQIVGNAMRTISSRFVVVQGSVVGLDHAGSLDVWFGLISTLYASIADEHKRNGLDLLNDHRDELPLELIRLIERGNATSAVEYRRYNALRTQVLDAIEDTLETADFIASPTLAVAEIPNASDGRTIGPTTVDGQPVEPTLGWCLTYPANLSGHPAMTIPAGFTARGMPVGLQLIGRRWHDWALVDLATAIGEQLSLPRTPASGPAPTAP